MTACCAFPGVEVNAFQLHVLFADILKGELTVFQMLFFSLAIRAAAYSTVVFDSAFKEMVLTTATLRINMSTTFVVDMLDRMLGRICCALFGLSSWNEAMMLCSLKRKQNFSR